MNEKKKKKKSKQKSKFKFVQCIVEPITIYTFISQKIKETQKKV